jgi:hypothetical protein
VGCIAQADEGDLLGRKLAAPWGLALPTFGDHRCEVLARLPRMSAGTEPRASASGCPRSAATV